MKMRSIPDATREEYAEAGVFTLELLRKNMVEEKAIFVILSSLLLGTLVNPTLTLKN